MTETTNIDDLIKLLNVSDTILKYNSEIETSVTTNGGTVLYSFNNIIIASEITDSFFVELQKNPNIDYIEELPLKKFGDVDINLIDQLDIYKLSTDGSSLIENSIIDGSIIVNTGITGILTSTGILTGTTTVVDGVSGKSKKSNLQNVENNSSIGTVESGIATKFTNQNLALTALTSDWFSYELFANGTTPITFEFITPANYKGTLFLQNSTVLSGTTNTEGVYNIPINVKNNYGMDTKNLTLTVLTTTKITNTNLQVYSKIGANFYYNITSIGTSPLTYAINNLPSELTLSNNIISGIFTTGGTYNMILIVSGTTNSDSKLLTVSAGISPVITSSGVIISEQYVNLSYTVTSEPASGVNYSILGLLPTGLQFNGITIEGVPVYSGVYNLKIKATNPFGDSTKDLNITIYQMGS